MSRSDVDPQRIAVTGISGGGAATFWIAAADERAKVAIPVSGMADLVSYLPSRMINGHCDCMFLYNTYQWHWTRIAGLVAPRPMLFVNSDNDPIFPMDANERIINRLERLYSLYGASDMVDSFVSIGGHDYREDIRQGVFRFLNIHLKNDPAQVSDTEVDLVTGSRDEQHPIKPEELRVFPKDENIPADALNAKIDEHFVPLAKPVMPDSKQEIKQWRDTLVSKLRQITFRHFPDAVPPATFDATDDDRVAWINTEENIRVRLKQPTDIPESIKRVVLCVSNSDVKDANADFLRARDEPVFVLEPRGLGATRWTTKNPPNFVERSHYLLGRTVDSGRVWDAIAAAKYLRAAYPKAEVMLAGEGRAGVIAVYAALLERSIEGVVLGHIPDSLMSDEAPALLNALRVCDLPEALDMLGERRFSTNIKTAE